MVEFGVVVRGNDVLIKRLVSFEWMGLWVDVVGWVVVVI